MPTRTAKAAWKDTVSKGNGAVELGSGAFKGRYSFGSRFEEEKGTNPEELIGAAHAGCFSMALANTLDTAGYTPESVSTEAGVHLDKTGGGFAVTEIRLSTTVTVSGIEEEEFQKIAAEAASTCPVSKALTGVKISLSAALA